MGKLPFTDYDFWAYLSAGFLFLVACDHAHGSDWMLTHTWTVAEALIATACAYVTGHLIAGMAALTIDRCLTRKWLGKPLDLLMGKKDGPKVAHLLLPSYFEPLPSETRSAVTAKAALPNPHSDALFWVAFTAVKNDDRSMQRINSFQNLYGMCRNLSFALVAGATLIAVGAWVADRPADYYWAAFAAFLGAGMFVRYLKFYRHYISEILTTFAYAK